MLTKTDANIKIYIAIWIAIFIAIQIQNTIIFVIDL